MTVVRVDPSVCTAADVEPAVNWLRSGRVVVFPTETFYGLAADPRSVAAVHAVFDLKGRRPDVALPLIEASRAAVESWSAPFSALTGRLAETYWPGPLSLIVEVAVPFAAGVAGPDGAVAVRVPAHPVALALARAFGGPLTATSANLSGLAPATRHADLGSFARDPRVLVIDGGETAGGLPSTIVDARKEPPRLVRDGAVPWSRVLESSH